MPGMAMGGRAGRERKPTSSAAMQAVLKVRSDYAEGYVDLGHLLVAEQLRQREKNWAPLVGQDKKWPQAQAHSFKTSFAGASSCEGTLC